MICWIVKNGVPFDVAYNLDESELLAYWVTFAQFETTKQWDWDSMSFVEPL
jgi:hypothetical protein